MKWNALGLEAALLSDDRHCHERLQQLAPGHRAAQEARSGSVAFCVAGQYPASEVGKLTQHGIPINRMF